ncbi:15770_t:CDS:10 [Entrophospora sp. SA101]|nr:15770_t:CDS:10 [Entrophospora sp. SA101]
MTNLENQNHNHSLKNRHDNEIKELFYGELSDLDGECEECRILESDLINSKFSIKQLFNYEKLDENTLKIFWLKLKEYKFHKTMAIILKFNKIKHLKDDDIPVKLDFSIIMTEPDLTTITWRSVEWIQMQPDGLNSNNVLDYFAESPFWDPQCSNNILKMQTRYNELKDITSNLRKMKGNEFQVVDEKPPYLWVIRKQYRLTEFEVRPVATYYVLNFNIYQAPDLDSIIGNRILTSIYQLSLAFNTAYKHVDFHPATGYSWRPTASSTKSTKSSAAEVTKTTAATAAAGATTSSSISSPSTISSDGDNNNELNQNIINDNTKKPLEQIEFRMGVDRVLKHINVNTERQLRHVDELLNRPPSPPPTLQDNNIISKNEPNILMTSPTLISPSQIGAESSVTMQDQNIKRRKKSEDSGKKKKKTICLTNNTDTPKQSLLNFGEEGFLYRNSGSVSVLESLLEEGLSLLENKKNVFGDVFKNNYIADLDLRLVLISGHQKEYEGILKNDVLFLKGNNLESIDLKERYLV